MGSKLVVSVSQSAVVQGESAIMGCVRCSSAATSPFWKILDGFRSYSEEDIVYILPALATCPKCRAPINEATLVEAKPARRMLSLSSLVQRLFGRSDLQAIRSRWWGDSVHTGPQKPVLSPDGRVSPPPSRRRRTDFISR